MYSATFHVFNYSNFRTDGLSGESQSRFRHSTGLYISTPAWHHNRFHNVCALCGCWVATSRGRSHFLSSVVTTVFDFSIIPRSGLVAAPCGRDPSSCACLSSLWVVSNYQRHIWWKPLMILSCMDDSYRRERNRKLAARQSSPMCSCIASPSDPLLPDFPPFISQVTVLWFRRRTLRKVRNHWKSVRALHPASYTSLKI